MDLKILKEMTRLNPGGILYTIKLSTNGRGKNLQRERSKPVGANKNAVSQWDRSKRWSVYSLQGHLKLF